MGAGASMPEEEGRVSVLLSLSTRNKAEVS